jgi:hypothetical protein
MAQAGISKYSITSRSADPIKAKRLVFAHSIVAPKEILAP